MPWRMALRHWAARGWSRMPNLGPFLKRYGVYLAVVLLIVFNMIVTPNALSMRAVSINFSQIVMIVIVGVGMTMVIATGGIDLSVGALMAIAGALSPMFF